MRSLRTKMKARTATKRGGFTLMEILIVLAILAVIASIAVPNLINSQRNANKKAALMAVKAVEDAVGVYATDHAGEFPAGAQGLDVLLNNTANDASWKGPYLRGGKLPADPWGSPIQYNYPGTHMTDNSPDIWSMGPDKQSGTNDDIGNWSTNT